MIPSCSKIDCNVAVSNETDDYTEVGTAVESFAQLDSVRSLRPRRKHQSLASFIDDEEHDSSKRQANLRQRLELYQSKGWLSQQEYRKYNAFLSTFDNTTKIGENGSYALKELEVELNLLENRMNHGKKPLWKKMLTPTKNGGGRFGNVICSKSPSNSRPPLRNATNRFSMGGAMDIHATILDPSLLSSTLSEDAISGLFVETCFFSRLGFVQPPCCLQCTYRETMKKSTAPNLSCKQWVIWRRNANNPLHPSHLCDNAVAVQCQTARRLTLGYTVESYKWDRHSKLLIEPPHASTNKKRQCS
jgi:hypothetical protein